MMINSKLHPRAFSLKSNIAAHYVLFEAVPSSRSAF